MNNILIIDNSKYVTGAAKSIARFAEELSGKYQFHWAVTDSIALDDLKQLIGEAPYYRFNFIEISRRLSQLALYIPQLIHNARKINGLVREKNIAIVHVNDCFNMVGVAVKLMNRRANLVYHVRLLRNSYIRSLYGTFLRFIEKAADAVICCSNAVSKDVGKLTIPKYVIPDSERFDDNFLEPTIRSVVRNIVYIGNLIPGKGHDLAIVTLDLLKEEFPGIHLHFIGKVDNSEISQKFRRQLTDIVENTGLQKRITFHGFKPDVETELAKADIALNLSESESFSMVCLEALKAGIPLVASDCGGPAELFEDGKSGFLVPKRDVIAAAEAIRTLVTNFELRKQFSAEGKMYVHKRFNVVVNSNILDNLYSGLINNPESICRQRDHDKE
jgi:glycosyltransferase involved in cell wall biosynthesis